MRLLIVDDSDLIRSVIVKELQQLGYAAATIDQAGGGADAIRKINSNSYDLIVLDVVMPGIDGIAVLREIKQKQDNTKVVMCTSTNDFDTVKSLIDMGIADYVLKPFSAEKLRAVLLRQLAGQ